MIKCRKVIALITAMILVLPVFFTVSFAKTEDVVPYCERIEEPILAVNLGGEDVTVEGAPFTGEKNEKNIRTFVKEPVELKAPNGTINAFTRIEAEDFIFNNGIEVEETGDVDGGENICYIANGTMLI